VFIIGIDPHKGSHTAAVLDRTESVIRELRVVANQRQRERLLSFAAKELPPTPYAGPSSSGTAAPPGANFQRRAIATPRSVRCWYGPPLREQPWRRQPSSWINSQCGASCLRGSSSVLRRSGNQHGR
jgi:hypothetical protein